MSFTNIDTYYEEEIYLRHDGIMLISYFVIVEKDSVVASLKSAGP